MPVGCAVYLRIDSGRPDLNAFPSKKNLFRYFSAESLFRFSKLSRLDPPRVVVYISAGNIFQHDFCIELS